MGLEAFAANLPHLWPADKLTVVAEESARFHCLDLLTATSEPVVACPGHQEPKVSQPTSHLPVRQAISYVPVEAGPGAARRWKGVRNEYDEAIASRTL